MPRPAPSGLFPVVLVAVSLAIATSLGCAKDLSTRLAEGDRSEPDKARDAGRKPAKVVDFLGVESGMTVLDLIAAGGWYTEVLAEAVGPDGTVYAQNNAFVLRFRDGANDKALTARLADGRLPNVVRLDEELDALSIEPGSVDVAITALNFHDVYNGRGPEAAAGFLAVAYAMLEPDGVLGIIDHVGVDGADNTTLHRIDPRIVEDLAKAAGFEVVARSDVLANPDDDHTKGVFDPALRGHTDRFVFKLRKP